MNGVEDFTWLQATLDAVVAGHPNVRLDDLLPRGLEATVNLKSALGSAAACGQMNGVIAPRGFNLQPLADIRVVASNAI